MQQRANRKDSPGKPARQVRAWNPQAHRGSDDRAHVGERSDRDPLHGGHGVSSLPRSRSWPGRYSTLFARSTATFSTKAVLQDEGAGSRGVLLPTPTMRRFLKTDAAGGRRRVAATPALRCFPRPIQVEMPLLTRASRIRVSSSAERIDDRARSSEKTWYADSTGLLTPLMVEVQVHSVVALESNWAP